MSIKLRWKAGKYEENIPLMCRLFGHIWYSGWWADLPYFRRKTTTTDNIGTNHTRLTCTCFRTGCKSEQTMGYIHD